MFADTSRRLRWLLLLLILAVTALGLSLIQHNRETAAPSADPYYTEILPQEQAVNVAQLLTIQTAADVTRKRTALITFLWGSDTLPPSLPTQIDKNFTDDRYADLDALRQIDRVVVTMEFGLESVLYHFHPRIPNGRVMLYHQGHRGDFHHSKSQIAAFLDQGYAVFGLAMPLLGLNNQPQIIHSTFGPLTLTTHEHMRFLTPQRGHPLKYFLEPVIVANNYLQMEYGYEQVAMSGISGGGWTTTLAAAVDPRIQYSFPAAGSYPFYLKVSYPKDWGDWEQIELAFYQIANYLDLYILGAYGSGRAQHQLLNQYDPCCYGGRKSETYEPAVKQRLAELGSGEFMVIIDAENREHTLSEQMLTHIFTVLEQ